MVNRARSMLVTGVITARSSVITALSETERPERPIGQSPQVKSTPSAKAAWAVNMANTRARKVRLKWIMVPAILMDLFVN